MAFISSSITSSLAREGMFPSVGHVKPKDVDDTNVVSRLNDGTAVKQSVLEVEDPVLQFDAYYIEKVPESADERARHRRVKITCYVDDGTIRIREPVQENSGLVQGTVLRRQQIPRTALGNTYKDDAGIVSFKDFPVPGTITIYSRTYNIIKCDKFTCEYLKESGIEVGEFLDFPSDPLLAKLQAGTKPPPRSVQKDASKNKKKQGISLSTGGRVLRFYCWWVSEAEDPEDTEVFHYILHFYADTDTAEVLEHREQNDGRDAFPIFLLRQKLPKKYKFASADLSAEADDDFYQADDLVVGSNVMVVGRSFHIYDCDDSTRQYYQQTYGIEQGKEPSRRETFDFDAFMEQLKAQPREPLIPRAPRNRTVRQDAEGKVMRFGAKLVSDSPIDKDRWFIISFFLADDTVSVYEPPQRNSGVSGGSFLRRSRLKRPDGDSVYPPLYYAETDLRIGTVLEVHKRKFALVDADEFALHYMESHPDQFPCSDVALIQQKLVAAGVNAENEKVSLALASIDSDSDGCVSVDEFKAFLAAVAADDLNEQEVVTLLRRYDIDGDGRVGLKEFMAGIVQ